MHPFLLLGGPCDGMRVYQALETPRPAIRMVQPRKAARGYAWEASSSHACTESTFEYHAAKLIDGILPNGTQRVHYVYVYNGVSPLETLIQNYRRQN